MWPTLATVTSREKNDDSDSEGNEWVSPCCRREPSQATWLASWLFKILYTFENFFHPFVSELIGQLNRTSVAGLLDPSFLQNRRQTFFEKDYNTVLPSDTGPVEYFDKTIDVTPGGPYANYNWELLYHIPIAVAVHLSKTQRFAEAQKWFHYVFDPTTTDTTDIKDHPTKRYWRFLGFRQDTPVQNINVLLTLLSTPDSELPSDQIPDQSR